MKPELTRHEHGTQPKPAYVERYVRLGEKLGLLLLKTGAMVTRPARGVGTAIIRGQRQGTQLRASSTLDIARRQQQAMHGHKTRESAANEDNYKSAA